MTADDMGRTGEMRDRRSPWGQAVLVTVAALAVLGAVAASPFLVGAGYLSFERHRFFERAPLLADLPASDAEAGPALSARLARAFPVGTPAADVRDGLARQGFAPAPSGDAAEAEFSGAGCRMAWGVTWTADAAGRVTALAGRQARACA